MEIKIENYWLPDLSVARYFVATSTPFLHVERPSFNQFNAKLRPYMFLYMFHMFLNNHLINFWFQNFGFRELK